MIIELHVHNLIKNGFYQENNERLTTLAPKGDKHSNKMDLLMYLTCAWI